MNDKLTRYLTWQGERHAEALPGAEGHGSACVAPAVERHSPAAPSACTEQQTCRCCGLTEHRGSFCSACLSHLLDFHGPLRTPAQTSATQRLLDAAAQARTQDAR